jgi:selenide, water dikinase
MPGMDKNTVGSKQIRLTETVQKGGCAAKLPAGQLRAILQKLKLQRPKELSVGTEHMDDACLWNLNSSTEAGTSLVQTLDFFTPIVDDAYDFGAIAAANAISDVYAMGGSPKIALSILAFPTMTLPLELLEPLLQGAVDKIHEAGACLAGGHTIDDDTLKFGLSVTGFVPTGRGWTNAGAKAGDALILTKALGTGTITSALKRREHVEEHVQSAIHSMKQLNRAPELLGGEEVHSATDITGFGLAGHALQMARASNVSLALNVSNIPALPGALACLEKGILNRAHKTNAEYVSDEVDFSSLPEPLRWLLVDPQTSGGLLLSVPNANAARVVEKLQMRFPQACVIGAVKPWTSGPRIFAIG